MRTRVFAALLALGSGTRSLAADFPADQVKFYERDVQPVLKQHCLKCHGDDPKKVKGGLNLTGRGATLRGGESGPAVDLKKPADSLLLKAVHYKDEAYQMPPAGKLPDDKIAVLEKWVTLGLPWTPGAAEPAAEQAHAEAKGPDLNYWAYQPVKRPAVPAVKDAAWVKSPIDAFIRAKQEAAGITPVGPAEKAALCRRAYYDLTGLPPTPEQLDAFVADRSADAFARLVDTLLASPQYGEKWGRHWLDVVRYAESNGYERDSAKPFAWRYRDYVIKSFNADKPYDKFVKEQLAGDEIAPDDADAVIATGFYRLGTWDDEPADRQQALYDGYDDLVTTAGQGFLAMSLNCNRCHDHKVDYFPQSDYYRMVAFFRDVRPHSYDQGMRSPSFTDIGPKEARTVYEAALREREDRLAKINRKMVAIEDAAIKKMPGEDQRKSETDRGFVVQTLVPKFLDADQKAEYFALKKERREVEKAPQPARDLALSVNNGDATPPVTTVLIRGNPGSPGKEVQPGFPSVFRTPDPVIPPAKRGAKSSGRRTVLADFIASKGNPLTARVMVNRVWQYHFGRGLIPTPNDFGKLGEPCSHPELLDWLAAEFVEPTAAPGDPWTLKRLHRLLMLSSTYQLSSAGDAANLKRDPSNNLRWRFDMRRLGAEEVRDSVLAVSGKLDPAMYGPSVYPKIPAAVLAGQSVPGNGWLASKGGGFDPKNPDAGNRRSVYVHVKRSLQVPVLVTHDQADTDSTCPVRYTSTVPTQALGLLNGEFANEQAAALAKRLAAEAPGDLPAQIARGVRLTTGRSPLPAEAAKDAAFVRSLVEKHGLSEGEALTRYALLLLNANEFVYLD